MLELFELLAFLIDLGIIIDLLVLVYRFFRPLPLVERKWGNKNYRLYFTGFCIVLVSAVIVLVLPVLWKGLSHHFEEIRVPSILVTLGLFIWGNILIYKSGLVWKRRPVQKS